MEGSIVENYITPFLFALFMNVYCVIFTVSEKINRVRIRASPIWIVSANDFCTNNLMYDIKDIVETKMEKNGWVEWGSLKNNSTVYIEIVLNVYGNIKRFILDDEHGWCMLKNNPIYTILREYTRHGVVDTDITELVKEYSNIPVNELTLEMITNSCGICVQEEIHTELLYSTLEDFETKTIVLRK